MLKIKSQDNTNGAATLSLTLDKDIPNLAAHFPGAILIPAYMQLTWIEQSLNLLSSNNSVAEFKSIKFIQKISPEGNIDIDIQLPGSKGLGQFKVYRDNKVLTSGAFILNG